MDPIRMKWTAAALAVAAVAAVALTTAGGRDAAPVSDAGDGLLVDRLAAALAALPTPDAPSAPMAQIAPRIEDTAAAIAAATRLALAEIAPVTAPAPAPGRPPRLPAAQTFVVGAADARVAAEQGWVAASGLAPAPAADDQRPRPRP